MFLCVHLSKINCFSGSNDSEELMWLPQQQLDIALGQFKNYIEKFLNCLLSVKNSYIILPSIFPRKHTQFDVTNNILEDIVRYGERECIYLFENVFFCKVQAFRDAENSPPGRCI